jgi:hypothetical protein
MPATGWSKVKAALKSGELENTAHPLYGHPGQVWRHENHFFYSFILTEPGAKDHAIPFMPTEKDLGDAHSDKWEQDQRRFGNVDKHLSSDMCFKTERVSTDDEGFWGHRHADASTPLPRLKP